ncbi:ABC-2 transporter permease [Nocardioides acrostichi]|uniref:DUF3533 domain-containing protein n=1 Tax=Nocardioides acrostichi TaxID=2784339 RepID=A0A930UXM1_9ACTN|nr:DUF3533 domain-containing protein [Nocardioides acrostichi]MBF4162753.1 DUF3533 domain-containing protein [Nocardioides acrostichi]
MSSATDSIEKGRRGPLAPVLLVAAVLLLQLGFIASYVGAFHAPAAHDLQVGVVGPSAAAQEVVAQADALDGDPLGARAVKSRAEAVRLIEHDHLVAALVIDADGSTDELLIASGGGSSLVTAVEQVATSVETQQQRTYTTTDVVPLQSGDARGLTGFYLVLGLLVGGYLMSAALGVMTGTPRGVREVASRLALLVPHALLGGLGGALVVDTWLGALTGHFWALAGIGALLVLAASCVTLALQVLLGTIGIGVTILLFVVLGNPSAGGAYQTPLLPAFWRGIGPWIPNGAGTEAIRRIVYFDAVGVAPRVALVAGYAVLGAAVALLGAALRRRRA